MQRLVQLHNDDNQDEEFRLGSGHNVPNSFLKTNVNKVEDEEDEEDDLEISKEDHSDPDDNSETKKNTRRPQFGEIKFSKIEGMPPEKIVYKYFRTLIKQWEWDLDAREDTEKQTARGKQDTKTQKQCKDYIRPLFKLCKKREVPDDILENLHKIVIFCESGDFRSAHDVYLRAAIGNSAWPIGLTMVGIHERSGREKISTSKVAHIMNNELQRKYFTSVKRLMTYAQKKSPDVAPSMKVL